MKRLFSRFKERATHSGVFRRMAFAASIAFFLLFCLFTRPARDTQDTPQVNANPAPRESVLQASPPPPPTAAHQTSTSGEKAGLKSSETDTASKPDPFQNFNHWQRRWQKSAGADRDELLATGIEAAAQRGQAMLKLMRSNPEEALAQSLSWSQWAALPGELKSQVEEPFSVTADYQVGFDCRNVMERFSQPQHLTWLKIDEEYLKVHPTKAWREVTTKYAMPVQGIKLAGEAVFHPGVVQMLSADDAAAVRSLLPARTGDPAGKVIALAGGETLSFPDAKSASEITDALSAALVMNGPRTVEAAFAIAYASSSGKAGEIIGGATAASLNWSATPKKVLGLRLRFTDNATTPYATSAAFVSNLGAASDRLREMSFGKSSLIITVPPSVLALPGSTASYTNNQNRLKSDARAAALAAGFNPTNYDILVFSSPPVPGVGPNVSASGDQNIYNNTSVSVLIHEFGHNLGLGHANFWVGTLAGDDFVERNGITSEWGAAANDEYGDSFDVMGVDFLKAPGSDPLVSSGDFSMDSKVCLGWMAPASVTDATNSGVYRIHRFDHKDASSVASNKLALSFRTSDQKRIWVGLRRAFPNNPALGTGAYVVWAHRANQHQLIDCTPFSRIDGLPGDGFDMADWDREDSALPKGMSWITPDASVRITNLGTGGTAPTEYLDLKVEFLHNIPAVEYFTTESATTPGLTGSYFNSSLRSVAQPDWTVTQRRTGLRIDNPPNFETKTAWGPRAAVGVTGGTDEDWENFSVQWDGYIRVNRPISIATKSDDGSRLWVDVDRNGTLDAGELGDNNWGSGQAATVGRFISLSQPGLYKIRAQFEEGVGGHEFQFVIQDHKQGNYQVSQDQALSIQGLKASYVNRSLRNVSNQSDWITTQTISGTRAEPVPVAWDNTLGPRGPVGITGGTDGEWQNFSVQYDGWINVLRPTRFITYGADGMRFWIDLDGNGEFGTTTPEYTSGNWGQNGRQRYGSFSGWVQPGKYRVRIQREMDGDGGNRWAFMGQNNLQTTAGRGISLTGKGYLTSPSRGAETVAGAFTVEAWVRPRNATSTMSIFSTRTTSTDFGFTFKLVGGNKVMGHIGSATAWLAVDATSTNQIYRAGEWMHVAYSVGVHGYEIYINGRKAASGGGLGGQALLLDANHSISIGRDGKFGEMFDGEIDEIRVWRTWRTGEQIASEMHRRADDRNEDLVACWHLDEAEGAVIAADSRGFWNASYNGTLTKVSLQTPVFEDFDRKTYQQDFQGLANGARELVDGARLISNNGVPVVAGLTDGNNSLLLTAAERGSTLSQLVLPQLNPSTYGFTAGFRYMIVKPPTTPAADGFGFYLKPGIEEADAAANQVGGYARGLGVEFITYSNPRHQIRVNNSVLPGAHLVSPAVDTGWTRIVVDYRTSPGQTGTLTVLQNGAAILKDVPVNYSPMAGDVFAFTARTLGFAESVFIDDIVITPTSNPPVVQNINRAPTFVAGPDQIVNEDATARFIPGWATSITPGPSSESTQTLSFIVSNNNPGLFSAEPTVDTKGALFFTPAPNANGTATITLQLKDNGSTAGGGVDTSLSQTFVITINPVNDRPTFTRGPDPAPSTTTNEVVLLAWATNISPGPANESGQSVNFILANSNPTLFKTQPAITRNGTLTFTPAPGVNASATVSVLLQDDGGAVGPGLDTSIAQTFVIAVNTESNPPVSPTILAWNFDGNFLDKINGRILVGGAPGRPGLLPALVSDAPGGGSGDLSASFSATAQAHQPVGIPSVKLDGSNYTVEAWVKFVRPVSGKAILVAWGRPGGGGWSTWIDSQGKLGATSYGIVDLTSTVVLPDDRAWHHVAFVHRLKEQMLFYVDGQLKLTMTETRGVSAAAEQTLHVGYELSNGSPLNPFTGQVDRLRISNAALNETELDSRAVGAGADLTPRLEIRAAGFGLVVSWQNSPGFILERASTIGSDAAWSRLPFDILGNSASVSILPGSGRSEFLRLRKP